MGLGKRSAPDGDRSADSADRWQEIDQRREAVLAFVVAKPASKYWVGVLREISTINIASKEMRECE